MPCLLGLLSLLMPRVVLAVLFLFTDYLHRAFAGTPVIWPILGFVFMPLTTLAYALAINSAGAVTGVYLVLLIVAVVSDLGLLGGASRRRR